MRILRRNLFVFCVLWILALFTFVPDKVFAHATLEQATPVPDSFISSSPEEVTLLFNERLEKELYSIKVFNKKGESVSSTNTRMSKDQKQITQPLPILPEGTLWGSFYNDRELFASRFNRKWSLYLQIAYLITNIFIGIILFVKFMDSWDIKEIWAILSLTTAGISWVSSIFISIIGFYF